MQNPNTNQNQNNNQNEIVLDLRNAAKDYEGLEIVESDLSGSSKNDNETITITEWIQLDGMDTPLLRLDFREMGYVSYSEESPP